MKIPAWLAALALAGALPSAARGEGPDDIVGRWDTAERDAVLEIATCGAARYCGTVVWARAPDQVGRVVLRDFEYRQDERTWEGGTVVDPRSGREHSGRVRLSREGVLELRAYLGVPLFGKTSTFTRRAERTDP